MLAPSHPELTAENYRPMSLDRSRVIIDTLTRHVSAQVNWSVMSQWNLSYVTYESGKLIGRLEP